ncbi:polysaccharide pyruvyl transferase family protein [Kaistella montana]|uniref:Polysaccharide pyruvyl transferase family protein n=1 Tax=Kaistella montana TaxID=1849733 RepID=A0ABW5KBD3_9FLAO|nr:polysaccharide pyruvyl transferase family protein [Kaistella montana]MCQ4035404.1 polysaccharide pyruvyl transferase family protein [Kaistella montana]
MKVLVHIYLADNLGDDLFAKILLERYPHVQFYFLHETDRYEFLESYENAHIIGLPKLGRINFAVSNYFSSKIAFFIYLKRLKNIFKKMEPSFSAFLVIGGSLFMEGKSEYLKKSFYNIVYDVFKKKPKFIIGGNFGPYRNKEYLEFFRKIFSSSTDVCFRDAYSYGLFPDISTVRLAPDVVFNIINEHVKKDPKKVGVVPISLTRRPALKEFSTIYNLFLSQLISKFSDHGYEVTMYAFCKSEGDEKAMEEIYSLAISKENIDIINYEGRKIDQFLHHFSTNSYVVTSRFHGMILGLIYGINTYPISYSRKLVNVLDDMNFTGSYKDIETLVSTNVDVAFDEILANHFNVQQYLEDKDNQFKILDSYFND